MVAACMHQETCNSGGSSHAACDKQSGVLARSSNLLLALFLGVRNAPVAVNACLTHFRSSPH
jgi:hypothetical protein